MAAGLAALGHDGVSAGSDGGPGLGQGSDAGKPGNAGGLQPGDERSRIDAHDGGHNRRTSCQHRVTLQSEILQRRFRRAGRDLWPPMRQHVTHPGLGIRGADGGRVRHPEIDLKRAVAGRTKPGGPGSDPLWRQQQRAQRTHAACIGHCRGQTRRTGTRHRRHQDRDIQAELRTKRGGAGARGHGRYRAVRCAVKSVGSSGLPVALRNRSLKPSMLPWT